MRLEVHWIDGVNPMDRWWSLSIGATGAKMKEAAVGCRRSPRATTQSKGGRLIPT